MTKKTKRRRTRSRRPNHLWLLSWSVVLNQALETLLLSWIRRHSCSLRLRFWLCLASTINKSWLSTSTSKLETSTSTKRSTTSKVQPFCTKSMKIIFSLELLAANSKSGTLTQTRKSLRLSRYSMPTLAPSKAFHRFCALLTPHPWLLATKEVKIANSSSAQLQTSLRSLCGVYRLHLRHPKWSIWKCTFKSKRASTRESSISYKRHQHSS